MKKLSYFIFAFILISFVACKKQTEYKSEIFIDKYKVIYGSWQCKYSVTEGGTIIYEDQIIEFIPIGKFRYNGGKTGLIKIRQQDDNTLMLDFDSLFPNVSWAVIGFSVTADSMSFGAVNGMSSLYVRIP